jgi:hypothetical protein
MKVFVQSNLDLLRSACDLFSSYKGASKFHFSLVCFVYYYYEMFFLELKIKKRLLQV